MLKNETFSRLKNSALRTTQYFIVCLFPERTALTVENLLRTGRFFSLFKRFFRFSFVQMLLDRCSKSKRLNTLITWTRFLDLLLLLRAP